MMPRLPAFAGHLAFARRITLARPLATLFTSALPPATTPRRPAGRWLAAALLALGLAAPATAADGVTVDAGWLTVKDVSLDIVPGSPLDFSAIFPDQKIRGRVEAGAAGQLQVAGQPARFLCGAFTLTPPYGGMPDKAAADRYALQMRRAGYNVVRFMHLDATLMSGRDKDFDYDPEQLDRLHYLMAALRKQGIYWMVDGMTSENGAYGNVLPHRWVAKHDLLARVHVDPAAREHWKRLVETLYGRINPYTGQSILADDALFGIIQVNEGGLQFLSVVGKAIPKAVVPALTAWLRQRHPQAARFEAIWQQPYSALQQGRLTLPAWDERSPRMEEVLAFYAERQADTAQWMESQLRALGYRGLSTSYDNLYSTHMTHSRARLGWVDMHAYHDEGSGFTPGMKINNNSSFDEKLGYITQLAGTRIAGKPFTVSEWGQPFWNAWRREAGIVFPAYAALHGWDAICQHASSAVDITYAHSGTWKQHIIPYAVGLDPVARAGETLAALFYRRGDVATRKDYKEIVLPGGEAEETARYWGLPAAVAQEALYQRTMIRVAGAPDAVPPGLSRSESMGIAPQNRVGKLLDRFIPGRTGSPAGTVAGGQIRLDMPARRASVQTPRSEGITFEKLDSPANLGFLRVLSSNRPASIAVASLDDAPSLGQSRRLLLVVATDALNTDMRFEQANRKVLRHIGRLPVRIEPVIARLELPGAAGQPGRWRGEALNLDGSPARPLSISQQGGTPLITIDTAALGVATPYFALYRD